MWLKQRRLDYLFKSFFCDQAIAGVPKFFKLKIKPILLFVNLKF